MKKKRLVKNKKLILKKTTIYNLTAFELKAVNGGDLLVDQHTPRPRCPPPT